LERERQERSTQAGPKKNKMLIGLPFLPLGMIDMGRKREGGKEVPVFKRTPGKAGISQQQKERQGRIAK